VTAELTCEWCDRDFTRPHAKGPVPRFCSHYHRNQAGLRRLRDELIELRAENADLQRALEACHDRVLALDPPGRR
jgi:hypothetical protein